MEPSRVLSIAVVVGAVLSGCARYELVEVKATGARLSGALHDATPDVLVVRVENSSPEPLFIDWDTAHLRGPDGFESPVTVTPERPLAVIYPDARIEYDVQPAHFYKGADVGGGRSVRVSRAIVPLEALRRHPDGFPIALRMRVCSGDFELCWTDQGKPRQEAWKTASLGGVVRRVR